MINKIKKALLKRFLNFRLHLLISNQRTYDFSAEIKKVEKILIILPTGDEYNSDLQDFVSTINKLFSKAKVSTFGRSSLRKSDLSWLGLPSDKYLRIFRDEEFDLIVDGNKVTDSICAYICALSGAPLRLNLTAGPFDAIYNLHVRSKEDKPLAHRLQLIERYLQTLQKSAA